MMTGFKRSFRFIIFRQTNNNDTNLTIVKHVNFVQSGKLHVMFR